jgi:hypothetical protein
MMRAATQAMLCAEPACLISAIIPSNPQSVQNVVSRNLKCYPWAIVAQFWNVTRYGDG